VQANTLRCEALKDWGIGMQVVDVKATPLEQSHGWRQAKGDGRQCTSTVSKTSKESFDRASGLFVVKQLPVPKVARRKRTMIV
jgi:hypothetical protein